MPPDFGNTLTGIPALTPSPNVQRGSSKSGEPGTGRDAALQQGIVAVQAALETIRANLASAERSLEFQVDPQTGLVVVTIKDAQTGELIRQIPGNAILRLAEVLAARDTGPQALVDLTA